MNHSILFLILPWACTLIILPTVQEPISDSDAANYAFSPAGSLYLATAYSHIAIPFSIEPLIQKLKILKNSVDALGEAQRQHGSQDFKNI